MVSSNHEKVIFSELIQDRAESIVELVHSLCIAFDIVSVAVLHVEVDEISKAEARKITVHHLDGLVDAVCVALCGIGFSKASSCEQVIDLADGDYVVAFTL